MKKDLNKNNITLLTKVRSVGFGLLGLLTIVALGTEALNIISSKSVDLGGLLLLFIYLQILAMVRFQLMTGKIPLSIPFTIAMLALLRYLMQDITNIASWQALSVGGLMLLAALSLTALRYWKTTKIPPKKK